MISRTGQKVGASTILAFGCATAPVAGDSPPLLEGQVELDGPLPIAEGQGEGLLG